MKLIAGLSDIAEWLDEEGFDSLHIISSYTVPEDSLENGGDIYSYVVNKTGEVENFETNPHYAIKVFTDYLNSDESITSIVSGDNLYLIPDSLPVTSNILDCRALETPDLVIINGYLFDLWVEKVFSNYEFTKLKELFNNDPGLDYDMYGYEGILDMIK